MFSNVSGGLTSFKRSIKQSFFRSANQSTCHSGHFKRNFYRLLVGRLNKPYRIVIMSTIALIYLSITLLLSLAQPNNAADQSLYPEMNQVHNQHHVMNAEPVNDPIKPTDRLIWAQILHRHGDRTPIHPLPKSFNQSMDQWGRWPLPSGSLTSTGWAQHQAVGRKIKSRYHQSTEQSNAHSLNLSTDYQPRSVYVRSTDVERCVQSVLALLSSIYSTAINPKSHLIDQSSEPSTSHSIPHPPLTIVPIEFDMLLQPSDKCPSALLSYKHTFDQSDESILRKDPTIKQLLDEHAGSFSPSVAYDILMTADWLLCEAAHNLSISEELTNNFDRLINLSRFASYNRYTNPSFTDPRGSAGDVVMKDLLRSAYLKLSNDAARREEKLRIYSSHDTTVLSLLSSLHVIEKMDESFIDPLNKKPTQHRSYDWLLPSYATVLTTELWMDETNNRPFVQFRIGAPKLNSDVEHVDSDLSDDWEFVDEVLPIRCPSDELSTRQQMSEATLMSKCDLAAFARYVFIMTNPSNDQSIDQLPTSSTSSDQLLSLLSQVAALPLDRYNDNDGCCVRPDDFEERCPNDQSFTNSSKYCQYFRRLCPSESCQNGYAINLSSMNCALNSPSNQSSAGFDARTLEAALFVTFGLLLVSLAIIGLQYARRGQPKYLSVDQSIEQSDERLGTQMTRTVQQVKRKARHARERDASEKMRLESSDDDDEYGGSRQ